ncbi:MAG TPA: aldo/keto reductase [Candidatus Acidoferrales bacterium]|nr:aldo/keto reductase [Candidatus Acidoferrales bacterium]
MERRQLGTSNLNITPIGVGAWAMGGGDWEFSWGPQDDQASIDAIHEALDRGINWIDTAAVYGLGHSEEVVARALEGRRDRPCVFTKCSLVWSRDRNITRSLKADSVRRECEASLRRLKIDSIDLYQIHWPDPESEIEEGWTELARLKEEGKVRNIGVSNFSVAQMKRIQRIAPITSLQPQYSILNRAIESEILPFAAQNRVGVIVYSPMASGLLTGAFTRERVATLPADDWRRRGANFQEPQLSRNLAIAALLGDIGKRHGRTPGEVAIAWTLHNPAVTAAIVGVRRREQVGGVIGALEFRLTGAEFAEIQDALAQKSVPAATAAS